MKKFVFLFMLMTVIGYSQYFNPVRQSSVTLTNDSVVTVSASSLLGNEESLIAIGLDANWNAGGNYLKFKVYDEVAGEYKYIFDIDDLIKYPAGKSHIVMLDLKHTPILRNFQIVKDSSGVTKKHYGTPTVITIYKIPIL